MKGMYTCKVCGRDFALMAEEHYTTKEFKATGVVAAFSSTEPKMHDAFDCPHCGCQNIVGIREPVYFEKLDSPFMTLEGDLEELSMLKDDKDES